MRVLRNSYVSLLAWGILLAGTSSLTSCAEDEVINNYGNKEDGAGISFSLSKDNNVWEADSRAAQPKQSFVLRSEDSADTLCVSAQTEYGISDALQADSRGALVTNKDNVLSFGVTSYFYTSTEETAVPAFYYMKNEEVVDGKTTKNKVYYWPPSNNELSFVAVAPYHALTLPDSPTASATLSYTVPADVADHEDLMVAKTARINNGATGTAVGLSFNHILTAVQFAIGEIPAGTITSISVSGDMIQGGTYTINSGEWTSKSTAAAATYTISEATTGAGVVTETIDSKKIVSEKIITMPQDIAANTLTLTVVFNDASAGERTLSASIPATTWAQGTTTTYTISISEAYTLEFIGQPEVQDAHYVIYPIKIKTENLPEGGWTLTSNDQQNVTFVENFEDEELRRLVVDEKYWLMDYCGTSSITSTTSGEIDICVFLKENITEKDRDITLSLSLTNNENFAPKTFKFTQYCPAWNNGIGVERIQEKDYPWGFDWDNTMKVTYSMPSGLLSGIIHVLFTIFGDHSYIDQSGYAFMGTWKVTVDFSKVPALNTATSDTDGLTNTWQLYNFNGVSDATTIMSQLESWGGVADKELPTNPGEFAAWACAKKNQYDVEVETNQGKNIYKPILNQSDMKWYLPSKTEAASMTDNLSGDYWTSTAITDPGTTSWKYTAGGSASSEARKSSIHVRAVRKKPTTTTE